VGAETGTIESNIFSLDAYSGKLLWRFMGNGAVFARPVSFCVTISNW
jgi:hypothetical protein